MLIREHKSGFTPLEFRTYLAEKYTSLSSSCQDLLHWSLERDSSRQPSFESWSGFTPLEFRTHDKDLNADEHESGFTPLEFRTKNNPEKHQYDPSSGFTPLEFRTKYHLDQRIALDQSGFTPLEFRTPIS